MIFWFTSSIAWASALSGLKKATGAKNIMEGYPTCSSYGNIAKCDSFDGAIYGAATVAVVGERSQSSPVNACLNRFTFRVSYGDKNSCSVVLTFESVNKIL